MWASHGSLSHWSFILEAYAWWLSMGCHRNFWAIVKYIFEIHGSIFKPNKIWKSHLPFQQYMNKEPRFQISAKSDNVWRKYITFSGSRSWIYLEVAVHYTAAPRCQTFSGTSIPGPVTANTITVKFRSDDSTTRGGFLATVCCSANITTDVTGE